MAEEGETKPKPKSADLQPSAAKGKTAVDAVQPRTSTKPRSPVSKRWWWIGGGAAVLIVAVVAGALLLGKNSAPANGNTNTVRGVTTPRPLDGVRSDAVNPNPTPIAVMIENITESRPQSGLNKASVVYEALAEGGITRFVAVFGPFDPIPEIGPVRSARPYYVDFAAEYKAVYGHIGGSPQALDALRSYPGVDLNEFFNNRYFWRDHARAAPHNVYTSSDKLIFARRDKKAPEVASFTPWAFAVREAGPATADAKQKIAIPFSSFNYNVEWNYVADGNRYERSEAGKPHVLKDGSTVSAKNVVVQFVETSLIDTERLAMKTDGTGRAVVYRDGRAIEGAWVKTNGRTQWLDANGNAIPLNPGTTWVEVVPKDRAVTAT